MSIIYIITLLSILFFCLLCVFASNFMRLRKFYAFASIFPIILCNCVKFLRVSDKFLKTELNMICLEAVNNLLRCTDYICVFILIYTTTKPLFIRLNIIANSGYLIEQKLLRLLMIFTHV